MAANLVCTLILVTEVKSEKENPSGISQICGSTLVIWGGRECETLDIKTGKGKIHRLYPKSVAAVALDETNYIVMTRE